MLPIGSLSLSLDRVRALLAGYPRGTVAHYDLGGLDRRTRAADDRGSLADLGRMLFLDPQLTGFDAQKLLAMQAPALWAAIAVEADLADADPAQADGLYDAAVAVYESYTALLEIASAKATKLLHLKRPALFPIVDAELRGLYDGRARECAARPEHRARGYQRMYWGPVREDLLAWREVGAFTELREWIATSAEPSWAQLTDLRLLDMTIWSAAAYDKAAKAGG